MLRTLGSIGIIGAGLTALWAWIRWTPSDKTDYNEWRSRSVTPGGGRR